MKINQMAHSLLSSPPGVLLKCQGVNAKGLLKAAPVKEEPQSYVDCAGNMQVRHVDGQEKTLLSASGQSKLYSGNCYIFQYSYPDEAKEELQEGQRKIEDNTLVFNVVICADKKKIKDGPWTTDRVISCWSIRFWGIVEGWSLQKYIQSGYRELFNVI